MTDGPVARLDERLTRALHHPDRMGEFLADLGNGEVAVPVLAAVLILVAWRHRTAGEPRWWLPALAGAAPTVSAPVLVLPVKALVARQGAPAVAESLGSFPSGHTVTAVVAYGTAAALLLPPESSRASRRRVWGVAACLILGVSSGLVRQGYHWPLDIAAGWCLGTVLLAVPRAIGADRSGTPPRSATPRTGRRRRRRQSPPRRRPPTFPAPPLTPYVAAGETGAGLFPRRSLSPSAHGPPRPDRTVPRFLPVAP
ncbi:phosphatase PAP2 family protein [Streptomyces sp. HSG2]|uniref:phosphatase PAP2 family protein n=1 Tax=Streptomyces sp. HSG2 TaxID=2797167 RepID=UPI001F5B4042|nr:phosphatase PAP2 family protein [Streptomyces sp. HSG2]